MVFSPLIYAVFLEPLLGPAVAVALLLAAGAWRGRATPGLLLGLGLLLPTFLLAQCLLSAAGWCVMPVAAAGPAPLYVPWYTELWLVPVCALYFWVLTNPRLRAPRAWRHLLPGLSQIGLFAGVAVLGLGYRHGAAGGISGSASPALALLRLVVGPLALASYLSLLLYGLKTLEDHRRYRQHLDANASGAERRQLVGQRLLLIALMVGFGLGLSFVALDAWFGPFHYAEMWYAFAVRGGLVFGLAVVGLQASYVTAVERRPAPGVAPAWARPQLAAEAAAPAPTAAVSEAPQTPPTPAPALAPELHPWRDKLLRLMADEQPWLEPELTLTELAQRLQTHPALLSKVINAGCGQNFNDFVNTYRVQEARRKLADPRFGHYSLVGVALESGFNSKSTFNRVFKKLLGQAPSEVERPKS
ncbi:helix-turn-helix domain-containing protein [Hymenobacter convexus]|uniref:helix-turn-helix domain-containing protein n=1 Tax=Hymenobacter sp. CA1UV-4 TaxID=3063782 RepID=UPI0027139454|nr:helix-turn-helix transcriptional regulator [Hymenobacter sp. CA1UV-4]MDO7853620.1 helix-turn-helix transcriptional regulator [Hymenobacter sp. CA1UV-4]